MLDADLARGSSASRSPSPKMFSATTVSTIAVPGTIVNHGAVRIGAALPRSAFPTRGSAAARRRRGNDSAASTRMLLAMIRVKKTRMVDAMFGSSSASITRHALAP